MSMSKAILVIDMPKSCENCRLINSHYDNEYGWQTYCGADYHRIREKNKKYFCPLKPLPQKKEVKGDYYKQREIATDRDDLIDLDKGYNKCIDEILGEESDNK